MIVLKKQKSNLLKDSRAIDNSKNCAAFNSPAMVIAAVTLVSLDRMLYLLIVPQTIVEFLVGIIFFKHFIYLFLREGKGRRKRSISEWLPLARPLLGTWTATQACILTGNQTCDPLVSRLALNPLSHTSQG